MAKKLVKVRSFSYSCIKFCVVLLINHLSAIQVSYCYLIALNAVIYHYNFLELSVFNVNFIIRNVSDSNNGWNDFKFSHRPIYNIQHVYGSIIGALYVCDLFLSGAGLSQIIYIIHLCYCPKLSFFHWSVYITICSTNIHSNSLVWN